jgi:spermidine/putrescine transport system substrate-binding protein
VEAANFAEMTVERNMKRLFITILIFFASTAFAKDNVVNVYNWASYMPPEVIALFQKETGIKVNYSTFESNQILYAKLKASPNSGYDIVVPTTYIVERMIKEKMVLKLDKSKLSNFKNLDPKLLNQSYDPSNQYSIPYLWGTTGILINTKNYSTNEINSWKDLWQSRFRKKLIVLNDMRDMFSVGLKVLGYSINDENPDHIKSAYLKLKILLSNVKAFVDNASQQIYINENVNIGMVASGDANTIISENSAYHYIYPKDGANIWMDNMVIPVGVKHLENAYKFINFILRPDVAKIISMKVGYSTPNLAAIKLMPKITQENRILNPTKKDLKNCEIETDLSKAATQIYLKYWDLLKVGA